MNLGNALVVVELKTHKEKHLEQINGDDITPSPFLCTSSLSPCKHPVSKQICFFDIKRRCLAIVADVKL